MSGTIKTTREKRFESGEIRELLVNIVHNNIEGNIIISEALIDKLTTCGAYKTALKNFCQKAYGRFGAAELRFCYDHLTIEEYIARIDDSIRKQLLSYYDMPSSDIDIAKTVSSIVKFMARREAKLILIDLSQEKYPGLTEWLIQSYVNLRKVTEYKIDLCNTNDEIVRAFFDATGKIISWDTINNLKSIFGHEPEDESSESYWYLRAYANRNKISPDYKEFAKQSGIEGVTNTQIRTALDSLSTLDLEEEDLEILQKWFLAVKQTKRLTKRARKLTTGMVKRFGTADTQGVLKGFLQMVVDTKETDPCLKAIANAGLTVMA